MADDELQRVRDQLLTDRLTGLREDRAEILAELDAATGDSVRFWEKQLEGVDAQIAAVADRRGELARERRRNRPDTQGQGRLL